MPTDTLLAESPRWISERGAEADCTVLTQLSLVRNLADFPFPDRCSAAECANIEDRVLAAFESINLLSSGEYYPLREIPALKARVLAERRLLTLELMHARHPGGIFVSKDQSLSILVNASEHITIRAIGGGQQLAEVWQRINTLDDALGSVLDYAFHEKLGFLAAGASHLGTGLKAAVLLHLPGLGAQGALGALVDQTATQRLIFQGVRPGVRPDSRTFRRQPAAGAPEPIGDQSLFTDLLGAVLAPVNASPGELYLLVNQGSLGESEEEILFHVRHSASSIIAAERAVRDLLLGDQRIATEDRIGRARGIAAGARQLSFAEGLSLLSSLRLGIGLEMLEGLSLTQLNRLLLDSQAGHLQAANEGNVETASLSAARANLFRARINA